MAILFFIGIVCVIFVMAVDASEANYKKKLEEKRRIYSRQLSTAEDEIVKKMKERYDLSSSEEQFRKNSVIHTVEKAGIYSVDLKRIYEPQSIDIWTNQENLCILTSWNFLKSQADSFKDFQATLVGLEYEYVEKELKKRLTTSERYLIHHYAIPLEKIEYFLTEGDIYTSTNVYGGGGTSGGSSVKGAVVGGVLGGSTGAIIGSRKESTIEAVKSNTIVHDEKSTIIKYRNEENIITELEFNKYGHAEVYRALKQLIPEKEYRISYLFCYKPQL